MRERQSDLRNWLMKSQDLASGNSEEQASKLETQEIVGVAVINLKSAG